MQILVLGGTRFIGAAAVRVLARAGHAVTCFHRGKHAADLPASVQHAYGERADLEALRATAEALAPEIVLDMRPLHEGDARDVVALADPIARRVVAISSMDVYRSFGVLLGKEQDAWAPGQGPTEPEDEDAPLRVSRYPHALDTPRPDDDPMKWADDYDKIPAEEVFLASGGTVLRLPMVYGPHDYQRRIGSYVHRMQGREAILLDASYAEWQVTRGYVDDMGAAIALAVTDERAAGRVYNVAEPVFLREREWVQAIASAAAWTGRIVEVPSAELPESLRVGLDPTKSLRLDSQRIRAELGYAEALPQTEAIARSVAWELAHPPDEPPDTREEDALLASLGA